MSIARKIYAILTLRERRRALVVLELMVVGMVLETFSLGLVLPTIALLTSPVSNVQAFVPPGFAAWLGHPSQAQLVVGGMAALVAIYLVKGAFLAFLAWTEMRFAYDVQAHLSHRLFAAYLHQPYAFHLQSNSAQMIQNVTAEVSFFGNVLVHAMYLATDTLILAGMVTLLLYVEPLGAAIVVVVLGGAGWLFYRVTRGRLVEWGVARQYREGMRIQHLQQGLGGVKEAKLLGREDNFLADYSRHNSEYHAVLRKQQTMLVLPRLWMEQLAMVGLAALVLAMLAQGREMASIVPTLGLFAATAFRMMPLVTRVVNARQSLRHGLPVIDTLSEELGRAIEPVPPPTATPRPFTDDVRLSGVSYAYPSSPSPAIHDVSLTIRKNESIGLIGPSGSGKSTLVDVLLGLLTPSAGLVSVDGQDIHANIRGWQDQVGYVPQTIFLTDDTLRRNVGFGLPDEQIDETAVSHAIHAAQLDDFVSSLPDGLGTSVGERGVRLSGGQRQRIGIARALYHNPAVLVLDEASSALDSATERDVMSAVAGLRGSRTLVIVAHRLSTLAHCDRIVRLDAGRVVEIADASTVPGVLRSV